MSLKKFVEKIGLSTVNCFKYSCTSVNFKRTRVRGARLIVENLTGIWVSRRGIEHFRPDGRSFGRH